MRIRRIPDIVKRGAFIVSIPLGAFLVLYALHTEPGNLYGVTVDRMAILSSRHSRLPCIVSQDSAR